MPLISSLLRKKRDGSTYIRTENPNADDSLMSRGLRLMQDNRLERLLDHRHKTIPEELEQLGITFPGEWFILVMLTAREAEKRLTDAMNDDRTRDICQLIEETLSDSLMKPWVFLSEFCVCAILNFSALSPEQQRLKIIDVLEPAVAIIRGEYGVQIKGYVSKLGQSMEELPAMRRELQDLYDYDDVLDEDDFVLTRERMNARNQNQCHRFDGLNSIEETERFFSAIKQENYREAKIALEELSEGFLGHVDTNMIPPNMARARLGYLINLLDMAVDATRLRVEESFFSEMFPQLDFRTCDNIQSFKQRAEQIFDQFIQYWDEKQENVGWPNSWVGDVKHYIDVHFSDTEMNVSTLADAFDLNPAYMGRIFRAKVGASIPEYIQSARIRRAKTLLGAGITVAETADRTGFGSVRSMTRAFQKIEGTTPGKFRTTQILSTVTEPETDA